LEIDQQFALSSSVFSLPQDEKKKYLVDKSLPGGPLGYKPAGERTVAGGLKDNVELYDDPKYNSFFKDRPRPGPCAQEAVKTEAFCRHIHEHILYRLLVLAAIVMELDDEEALWKLHNYDSMSNCHMRYMAQHPRTAEETKKLEDAMGGEVIYGHTDFGTFTFLFRQPVAALQVRLEEEKTWKWVKPVPGSITVNVADTLSFLTGGYLKSSIHRVVLPPEDQRHVPRLSVIYFSRPDDDTPLQPVDSPVIRREGNKSILPPNNALTAGEWVQARYNNIPSNYAKKREERLKVPTTVIANIEVKTYA